MSSSSFSCAEALNLKLAHTGFFLEQQREYSRALRTEVKTWIERLMPKELSNKQKGLGMPTHPILKRLEQGRQVPASKAPNGT